MQENNNDNNNNGGNNANNEAKIVKNQINVEFPEDLVEGVYSNMAVISFSASEFVMDFLRIIPNSNKAKLKSRVILTPDHAKRLVRVLQDNLSKYESQFGMNGQPDAKFNPPFPINLSGSGEA